MHITAAVASGASLPLSPFPSAVLMAQRGTGLESFRVQTLTLTLKTKSTTTTPLRDFWLPAQAGDRRSRQEEVRLTSTSNFRVCKGNKVCFSFFYCNLTCTSENLKNLPLSQSPSPLFLICLIALMADHKKKSPPARGATVACPKAITSLAISSPQLNILPTDIAWLPSPTSSTWR